MALAQAFGLKYACVSLPSGAASAVKQFGKTGIMSAVFRNHLAFDMDEAGREAAQAVAEILPVGRAFIADLPARTPVRPYNRARCQSLLAPSTRPRHSGPMASKRQTSSAMLLLSMKPKARCAGAMRA